MSRAIALTPRVLGIVLCDMAMDSDPPEWGVIDLEKVRHRAFHPRFDPVHVYLQLEYPRGGTFQGFVRVVRDDEEISRRRFSVDCGPGGPYVGVYAGEVTGFDLPGRYHVQVVFLFGPGRQEVLKGERPFDIVEDEP